MEILREYEFRNFKQIKYDGNDSDLLKKRFPQSLKPETIDRLCKWLLENNESVIVTDCYDGASGWQGVNFVIGKADLSCNGYCLSDSQIEKFLKGETNKMWY